MKHELIKQNPIEERIFLIRGHRVMLSSHLAEMYGVEVRALIQAVKRNKERFPKDFMFQLSDSEYKNLKSQIVISSWGGSRRAKPYAFTEQGVAMLSSVIKSKKAVKVNIAIMRAFVRLRRTLFAHKKLARKLQELEHKIERHDGEIKIILEAIRKIMEPGKDETVRVIGFKPKGKKPKRGNL